MKNELLVIIHNHRGMEGIKIFSYLKGCQKNTQGQDTNICYIALKFFDRIHQVKGIDFILHIYCPHSNCKFIMYMSCKTKCLKHPLDQIYIIQTFFQEIPSPTLIKICTFFLLKNKNSLVS